jgi:hypothetical protein
MGGPANYFEDEEKQVSAAAFLAPFLGDFATHDDGDLFAHYTSLEALSAIIASGELRFYGSYNLNDTGEFLFGAEAVEEFLDSHATLTKRFFGFSDWADIEGEIRKNVKDIERSAYISCLSRHTSKDSKRHGNLSMWKSYGKERPVAIMLDPYFLELDSRRKGVFTFPVRYVSPSDRLSEVLRIERNIGETGASVSSSRAQALQFIRAVVGYCYYLKHNAFEYENEWRMVHDEQFFAAEDRANFYRIPCGERPCFALRLNEQYRGDKPLTLSGKPNYLKIRNLIRGVVVGPSKHQSETVERAKEALSQHFSAAECDKMVVASQIPYRT